MPAVSELAVGPFLAACALLVAAGVSKLRAPRAAGAALEAVGVRHPVGEPAARAVGGIELATGLLGALVGGIAAVGVGALYVALGAFALVLLRRAPGTGCGCLGAPASAPMTGAHVAVNLGAAIAAFVAAPAGAPAAVVADQPLGGLPFLALVACCAWLAALVVDALGTLRSARTNGRS